MRRLPGDLSKLTLCVMAFWRPEFLPTKTDSVVAQGAINSRVEGNPSDPAFLLENNCNPIFVALQIFPDLSRCCS
jgi:hypothetical protein